MTISDLVQRLTKLYKDGKVNSSAQVKLNCSQVFDYFEIKTVGDDVFLVPTDVWNRKEKDNKTPFYSGE